MCVSPPTWALDERPVVFGLSAAGTHTGVESRLAGCSRHAGLGGWRRHSGLEGSAVRALHALALARVGRVGAPAAARLVQALDARPVARAVLSCSLDKRLEEEEEGEGTGGKRGRGERRKRRRRKREVFVNPA